MWIDGPSRGLTTMVSRVALSLLSLPVVLAAPAEECTSGGSCEGGDATALLQFSRVGRTQPNGNNSFALRTQPFFHGDTSARGILRSTSQQGKLLIDEDGELNTYYLPGATTLDRHMAVQYKTPYRFYLMKEPTTDYGDESKYYKPSLLGKTLTFDVDFGAAGLSCGCSLKLALVDTPVRLEGKALDYWCDAQCFPDMGCCDEFEINAGTPTVQQVSNHACTHNYSSHPDWACHKTGEPKVQTQSSDFGPGSEHTIDSTKPFTFSQRYGVSTDGNDLQLTTTMSQDDRSVSMTMGPGNDQLNSMLKRMKKGMSLVTGFWHNGEDHIDGQCGNAQEYCSQNPALVSNWRLYTNGPVPAPPPPMPTPVPTPAPAPTGSKCCWEGCSSCQDDMSNWCNLGGEHRCTGPCDGNWC